MTSTQQGIVLKDRHGEIFYRQGTIKAAPEASLEEISDDLKNAVIASEDKNFYEHEGYSLRGIAAAVYANIMEKDATRYGGSTITQQLVKNQLLSADKSYVRKFQEVSMAVAMERKYQKDDILEMYLNSVYFGQGAYGISEASRIYFDKTPAELSLSESSLLIGLLPAPNLYSPLSGSPELSKVQQDRVLSAMVDNQYITTAERDFAFEAPMQLSESGYQNLEHAPHYTLMVLSELRERYGHDKITNDGFEVTTSLDLKKQKQLESTVQRHVNTFQGQGGRNAGAVAIDPRSGEVLALVGSVDWHNQEFGKVNMALSLRQPGSSFKPIYYAEALDRGIITPSTILKDEKRTFGDWTPDNYDFKFRGNVSVRNALALSLNIPAAEVMEKLGTVEASAAANRMGINTVNQPEKYGLTLSLGTAETTLLDMTNAYSTFANQGLKHEPVFVTSIQNKYEANIFTRQVTAGKSVIKAETAYLISNMLSDNNARAPTFGSNLNLTGRQAAVKTGTTNDNRDAWTIGYTPGLAVGIWVGNNENEPMQRLVGSSSAGVIWRDSMNEFLKGSRAENFKRPTNIVQIWVCRESGKKTTQAHKSAYQEYFIREYEPQGECIESRRSSEPEENQRKIKPPKPNPRQQNRPLPRPTPVREAVIEPEAEVQAGGRGGGPEQLNQRGSSNPSENNSQDDLDSKPKPDKVPMPDITENKKKNDDD